MGPHYEHYRNLPVGNDRKIQTLPKVGILGLRSVASTSTTRRNNAAH
jgi:hypothetical protein